jgi:hypothetical protein
MAFGMCVRNLTFERVFLFLFIANTQIVFSFRFGQSVRIHLSVLSTSLFADAETTAAAAYRLLLYRFASSINVTTTITSCSKY